MSFKLVDFLDAKSLAVLDEIAPGWDRKVKRLGNIEPLSEIVYIMQEPPKGETAIIGKTPINIRSEVKKGAKNGKSKLA